MIAKPIKHIMIIFANCVQFISIISIVLIKGLKKIKKNYPVQWENNYRGSLHVEKSSTVLMGG
jgi:hypothetical protein